MFTISDHALKRWRQRIGRQGHTKEMVSEFLAKRSLRPVGKAMPFRRRSNADYYELHFNGKCVIVVVATGKGHVRTFLYSARLQKPGVYLLSAHLPARGWVGIYRGPTRWRCLCEARKMALDEGKFTITELEIS